MKFYHVSEDIYNEILEFRPRVPKSILGGEDNEINRVCITREIKNCINAISYYDSVNFLYSSIEDNEVLYGNRLLKVYEFEINEDDELLRDSFEIDKYVPDAIANREFWYMGILVPIKSYTINILEYICNDDLSVNCTDIKYEIVDVNDIPSKAIIEFESDVLDIDLYDFVEHINEYSNIRGYVNNNQLIFLLDTFPMTYDNYKKTFNNMFIDEKFDCEFVGRDGVFEDEIIFY